MKLNIVFAILSYFVFVFLGGGFEKASYSVERVALPAEVLVLLGFGDRRLAANLNNIRVSARVGDGEKDALYLLGVLKEVSRLNPCHEDAYYLSNAIFPWDGRAEAANGILMSAAQCRWWDGVPLFFYGFNKYFFEKELDVAASAFEKSALRWHENSSALLKLAVMSRIEKIEDLNLAIRYLRNQRDLAGDQKLFNMLDKRVARLEGLKVLRDAHAVYKSRFGSLSQLNDLVAKKIISEIPRDPLGLGYELRSGEVVLKGLTLSDYRSAK